VSSSSTLAQTLTIHPGLIWPDDRGKHIQAHGGGIIQIGDTWYWVGEDRSSDNDPEKRYVACYSSTDLVNWKFLNQIIALGQPEGFPDNWVIERPKLFHCAATKKFVLYMHIDGAVLPHYPTKGIARVAVAVCDTVDGNYDTIRSFRPLGMESRDIGQFIDDDGTPYLIFESRPTKGFVIASLSPDYLDVVEQVCLIHAPLEGGAIVNYEGLYYVIGSALTGWWPNANKYATAKSLAGPWSEFQDFAPVSTHTYLSQSSNLIKVTGSQTTSVIYVGDRWRPEEHWDSRYIWMPLEIGGGELRLPEPMPWTIDLKTGETRLVPSARRFPPDHRLLNP